VGGGVWGGGVCFWGVFFFVVVVLGCGFWVFGGVVVFLGGLEVCRAGTGGLTTSIKGSTRVPGWGHRRGTIFESTREKENLLERKNIHPVGHNAVQKGEVPKKGNQL